MSDELALSTIDTGWKSPPTLADLKQNYTDGKSEHDAQQTKIDTWRDNLHITGTAKKAKIPNRSNVQPKLIRKQAEWRYPALSEPFLSTDDVFNIYPTTHEDVHRARQNALVLNNQFNTKINKVKFIDDYVRASVDEGTIIVRVGWNTEEEAYTEEVPTFEYVSDPTGQAANQYMQLIQLKQVDPEQYAQYTNEGVEYAIQLLQETGQVVIPRQIGTKTVDKTRLLKNHPTVEVCDSNNVIIDPSCNGDITKAQFVAYDFETSLSELKKKGDVYQNLESLPDSPVSPATQGEYEPGADTGSFSFKDKARAKFVATEYWGYWDYNDTGIAEPFVATWVGDVLIRMQISPFPDKELPWVVVPHMPVKRSIYGEPDGELLSDNQRIVGAVTRGAIDIMGKSAAGQTGTRTDFLDATNRKKYREGRDYNFNPTVDPRMGIFQHTYPEIPQSVYNMLTIQNAEAESFSGVKAYNNGINSGALGEVAAGIRGALDAASRRELSILRRLANGMIQIGHKIIAMNAELLSEKEVIRITDEKFVTVMRDDLGGKFDIRLSISTAEEDNAKAQELAFMLQTGAASADPGEVRMIRAEIARLRKMPDLAKRIEEYQPQPDPMQVQLQQMQMQLLSIQIQKEAALARKHGSEADLNKIDEIVGRSDAILNMAKAETEKAKARHLGSMADSQDLDYLEQESGVHQERDMQKITGQAAAQTQMKIVEALLKPKEKKAA